MLTLQCSAALVGRASKDAAVIVESSSRERTDRSWLKRYAYQAWLLLLEFIIFPLDKLVSDNSGQDDFSLCGGGGGGGGAGVSGLTLLPASSSPNSSSSPSVWSREDFVWCGSVDGEKWCFRGVQLWWWCWLWSPGFSFFHFVRRFWNHIFTYEEQIATGWLDVQINRQHRIICYIEYRTWSLWHSRWSAWNRRMNFTQLSNILQWSQRLIRRDPS